MEVSNPNISKSFSFGIVTRLSTSSTNDARPFSAAPILFFPSNLKGFVTTATVNAPNSFAIDAITGAAPVPVPPPIPAVMKTISAPDNNSSIAILSLSAALLPISGSAPAPNPLVKPLPSFIVVALFTDFKA